jgi:biotin-dependent carboxylase-like uncharacterized protein
VRRALEVLSPGLSATVQDLGRPGLAHLGVGPSGAADRAALRRVNRLLGNPEGAAAVEAVWGGLRVRAAGRLVVAVGGAAVPVTVGGRGGAREEVLALADGEELALGAPAAGLRSYLAVRGGLAVPAVLGSRSTDTLAALGPPALVAGAVLPVGPPPDGPPVLDALPGPRVDPVAGEAADLVLRVVLGPREDWFTNAALEALLTAAWTVSPDSDRVGMRLLGPDLPRRRHGELPSEGLVRGALQVATGGTPTLVLADHPVTGGYPVLAVVRDADTDAAAQARPGRRLRFTSAAVSGPPWAAGSAWPSAAPG